MHDSQTGHSAPPLRSEFADDPDMADIVELFMDELPGRLDAIRAAMDSLDRATLTTLTHQLKGAAGGYGFPSISERAGRVEHALREGVSDAAALRPQVEDLIALCERARKV